MNIKHFNIMVTEQECGHARASLKPADMTAYLLDRLPHKPELLRPAVVLCAGGGYGFVSPREDQPVAMEFLAAGCPGLFPALQRCPGNISRGPYGAGQIRGFREKPCPGMEY